MKRRSMTIVMVLAALLLATSLVPAAALEPQSRSMVRIDWRTEADLALVEASGVLVYARLESGGQTYFLAGATTKQVESLRGDGLNVSILDATVDGGYYVASAVPGRAAPDWQAYGRLLLDDGTQALLRASAEDAERLSLAGAQIRAVTLSPKPVRPASGGGAIEAVEWDPLIQSMIDQVTSDQVSQYDRELAGELPVWVDGAWYTITSRYTYSGTPIQKATSYIGELWENLGLDVEYHVWGGATYPNVIGELPGLVEPENVFIIGGHVDAVSGSPGADDNASGSVAAMIAADIMTQFQWGCTLRFAVWTGEEQGLNGSYAYAQRAYNNGENILGYLNLDMIAWNTLSSPRGIDLYYSSSVPGTLEMAQQFSDVLTAYDIDLVPDLGTGEGGSDHASFLDFGYKAILGIEDEGDFNPYYHSSQDTSAHTDLAYFTDYVKASIADYAHLAGCLIPSGIGTLEGHVTAANTGAPIAGALVTITDPENHTSTVTTGADGYYTKTLLENTYTVTASAYGYNPKTVAGVVVSADTVTTQDFALTKAPVFVVKGTVTDSASGTPLAAEVAFEGSPVVVSTDPATGKYRAVMATGTYVMHVSADLHQPEERTVVVNVGQIQDFALDPLPCILLVDDDNNAPDTRPYFTAALDTLGYEYDVFETSGGSGPGLDGLLGYKMVLWFSGDTYGGTAGPNSGDETNLTAYLNAGGNYFLTAQDYLYDMGVTTFGQSYLGIGSYSEDAGNATAITGVAGDPVGSGLGPFSMTYPSGFTDYGDSVTAGNGGSQAFRSQGGVNLDVDKTNGTWHTVFFGTDWAPVANNNAANGRAVMQRVIDWFGGCAAPATVHVGNMIVRWKDAGGGVFSVMGNVPIADQAGAVVPGATVSARWTLPDGSTQDKTAVSGATGVAKFRVNNTQHGEYELCVTDVVAAGYTYDPGQNVETCETVVVP